MSTPTPRASSATAGRPSGSRTPRRGVAAQREASWLTSSGVVLGIFVEMVRAPVPGACVEILVGDPLHADQVAALLRAGGVPLERVGRTTCAPTTRGSAITARSSCAREGSDAPYPLLATDWGFNAWGQKYPPWERDDAVCRGRWRSSSARWWSRRA